METKGMTAIVRGLPDSRLLVTLMDDGRQYTLMPQEAEIKETDPRPRNICANMSSQHTYCVKNDTVSTRCDIGSQAVDSRYASSYKMDYCHLRPTSPTVEVTEFPPQHSQFHPGRGNFDVGGLGSGSHSPIRSRNTYTVSEGPNKALRFSTGRSITTDSVKPDAFTESLRKYPSMSPESSEVVQHLYSYSNESNASRSNLFKLNECVNCYHATIDNGSPHISRRTHWKPKTLQEESKPDSLAPHCSISNKPNVTNTLFGKKKLRHVMRSNKIHSTNQASSDSAVVKNDTNVKKTSDNITTPVIIEKEIITNTDPETGGPPKFYNNEGSHVLNLCSTKASKSLKVLDENKKKEELQKRKKNGPHLQLFKKGSKIKCKPRFVTDMNKKEMGNFKSAVSLVKSFNDSYRHIKLEEKIKMLVCKLLEDIINPDKTLKEELLKCNKNDGHITTIANENQTKHGCIDIVTTEKTLDEVHKKFMILWKNHLKQVSEIHRIITKQMLRIVKCILKKNGNKQLEFSVSKIFENIQNTFMKKEEDIFMIQGNYLESGNSQCEENKRTCAKKYNRYLKSLRKLIKSETVHVINNYKKKTRKPLNLTYKNIIKINRVLNSLNSVMPFKTEYVTNMLLNQYCMTTYKENICHQRTENSTVRVACKCLSDTYVLIHSTSQNKSVLTQSKIDKMNLQHGTKLLTSIKNKCSIKSNIVQTQNKYNISDDVNLNQCNTDKHEREHDISSLTDTIRQHTISEEDNYINDNIYREIQEKVYIWFSKYYNNLSPINNNFRENICNSITKDVTDQIKLFNMMTSICSIKSAYAQENFKNIICRHLYSIENDGRFELVKNVSELVQDILHIRNVDISNNSREIMPNSVENTHKQPDPMISVSKSFQSLKNVLEDIYARVEFCDDDVRKTLVKKYTDEVEKHYNNIDNDVNEFYKEPIKYSHFYKKLNKSGIINVAMANECTSNHSCHSNRSNVSNRRHDKTHQTGTCPAVLADNEAQACPSSLNVSRKGSVELAIQKLHEYCVQVFRKHCDRLPILAITPELEELARAGVLHNIMNTFSTLLKDPDIANDYTLFELYMEDDTDELLDLLPQTEDIKRVRETWKINLLMDAIMLLKHIHKITDAPGFENKLNEKTSRRKLLQENKRENDEAQQLNVVETVEEYMKSTNYHDPNPLVVRIYAQRLSDRTNELYNCFKKKSKTTFLKLPVHELRDVIFRGLNDVSKPNNNITKEEIDLVNMNDEIANWYKELPVVQMDCIVDNIKRKILIQSLAKKIHNMEKNLDVDEPSIERNMKHEISMFLSNKAAGLQCEQDLNINSMVDKLTDRLRQKRHEKLLNYESFVQDLPLSSTMVQHDRPCNDRQYFSRRNEHMLSNNEQCNIHNRSKNLQDSCLMCDKKNIRLKPIARTTTKGILGISQVAGPSNCDNVCPSPAHLRVPTTREAPQTISEFGTRSYSPNRYMDHTGAFYDMNRSRQNTPPNNIYIKQEVPSPNSRCINDQMTPSSNRYIYDQRPHMNDTFMNGQFTPNNSRFTHLEGATSSPYQRQKRSANSFSLFRKKRRADNFSNFTPYDLRFPYPAHAIDTSSTCQMDPYPDRIKTFNFEPGRRRNPHKVRCLCADRQMQPCDRYTYYCQDHFTDDCYCRFPYNYFY